MNIKGTFRNLELWVPLNVDDMYSRVCSLSLSTQISYKTASSTELKINQITEEVLSQTVTKSQEDAIITINQFTIEMVNRHLL